MHEDPPHAAYKNALVPLCDDEADMRRARPAPGTIWRRCYGKDRRPCLFEQPVVPPVISQSKGWSRAFELKPGCVERDWLGAQGRELGSQPGAIAVDRWIVRHHAWAQAG